jgi:hypothetical protein
MRSVILNEVKDLADVHGDPKKERTFGKHGSVNRWIHIEEFEEMLSFGQHDSVIP